MTACWPKRLFYTRVSVSMTWQRDVQTLPSKQFKPWRLGFSVCLRAAECRAIWTLCFGVVLVKSGGASQLSSLWTPPLGLARLPIALRGVFRASHRVFSRPSWFQEGFGALFWLSPTFSVHGLLWLCGNILPESSLRRGMRPPLSN